jgi:hypothetical protein
MTGADKKGDVFRPKPASEYSNRQTQKGVVIAAEAYTDEDKMKPVFGKVNPYEHGALPVLLVIENNGKDAIKLQGMQIQYIDAGRRKADAIPAGELRYLKPVERPKVSRAPIPGINRPKKNPLAAEEIETRAFAAKMIPPGDKAWGFVYFQAIHDKGAMLYITGLENAATGQELFYFEVPLD